VRRALRFCDSVLVSSDLKKPDLEPEVEPEVESGVVLAVGLAVELGVELGVKTGGGLGVEPCSAAASVAAPGSSVGQFANSR